MWVEERKCPGGTRIQVWWADNGSLGGRNLMIFFLDFCMFAGFSKKHLSLQITDQEVIKMAYE